MTNAPSETLPGPPRPTTSRALPWLVAALIGIIAALTAASTVEVPYYAIAPGSAVSVGPLVHVVDGPSHPPKGAVLLTTVSLGKTTVLQALEGWLNPDIDVVEQDLVVPPDTNREESRQRNLQDMDISKQTALGVAFEHLGFDAITGKGALVVEVVPRTPADEKLRPGDVITAIDGQAVEIGST